jgi:hypothetical protein
MQSIALAVPKLMLQSGQEPAVPAAPQGAVHPPPASLFSAT